MEIYSRKLDLVHDCLKRLQEIKGETPTLEAYRSSWKNRDATERNLQKIIEAIIDIGKVVISDKGFREPGNNREVFLILQEQGLFPPDLMPLIDRMIGMRNILVHSYDRIDDSLVFRVIKHHLKDIRKLARILKEISLRDS